MIIKFITGPGADVWVVKRERRGEGRKEKREEGKRGNYFNAFGCYTIDIV